MQAWRDCKLGEVVNLKRGYDLPHSDRVPGPFPIVSSAGVTDHHSEFKVKAPGVVTGRYGTLGEVFFIEDDFWPLNTSLYVQDFKGNDPRFISYFLRQLNFGTQNAAGAVPGVNRNHLHAMDVRVPPLREQVRIAGILSAYDELIENSQRRIRILETMARAIYREWFVHFRFPGHEEVSRVASPLGDTPDGWDVRPLGEVVDDIVDYRGKTPAKLKAEWSSDGVLALSALNVKGGRLVNLGKSRFVDDALYSRWMKNPLRRGDILMTSEAPLGELFFLCREERYCLSQRLFSIRANPDLIFPVILYLALESEQGQHQLASRATGATVGGIRQSELRKIPIPLPPRALQERAQPTLLKLAELKSTLDARLHNLRRTRDLLLPRLLSGEIGMSLAS